MTNTKGYKQCAVVASLGRHAIFFEMGLQDINNAPSSLRSDVTQSSLRWACRI
jgi:hypothetical protein